MNRQDLIDAIAPRTGESEAVTGEAFNAVLDTITRAVTAGDAVQLARFRAFSPRQRAARTGRNPSMGDDIRHASAKTAKFTAGKAFRESVRAS